MTKRFTVTLSDTGHKRLVEEAGKQHVKPATMAAILLEFELDLRASATRYAPKASAAGTAQQINPADFRHPEAAHLPPYPGSGVD